MALRSNFHQFIQIFALLFTITSRAPSQTGAIPNDWIGVWRLDVGKSTFGNSLFPGAPAGLTIISQTLRIEQVERDIRLTGETVFSGAPGPAHDDIRLNLNGTATTSGPMSLSFKRDNASGFDVISRVFLDTGNIEEVSHFAFSPDGKTLTETKTQTQRRPTAEATKENTGEIVRTSKFVLVFSRFL